MNDDRAFLEALFGANLPPAPDGRPTKIALWRKSDKRSVYAPHATGAVGWLAGNKRDTYVSVALAPRDLGKTVRIKATQAAGIAGLWADIDIEGGPEERKRPPAPNVEAALEVARAHLEPTLLVWSGYGLQAWWLVEGGPWVFEDGGQRERAARIAAGWIALCDDAARERGFQVDPTQDLARLMRIPGGINCKGGMEALVRGYPDPIVEQAGPRHPLERLAELALGRAPKAAPARADGQLGMGELALDPEVDLPHSKLEALFSNSDTFKRTFHHERRDTGGWSLSEFDLSLASQAAAVGWTDQEIANLIVVHRRQHGSLEKAMRGDYVARTIAKARFEEETRQRDERVEDALDDLAMAGSNVVPITAAGKTNGRPTPEDTISTFNRLLPLDAPAVMELIKDGTEPGEARYTLILANGQVVRVGGGASLLDFRKFKAAWMDVTNTVITPAPKAAKWEAAIHVLLKAATVRESPDDTPEGIVVDYLQRYLYDRLPKEPGVDHKDHACRRRDPFVEDATLHVCASTFTEFVRVSLRATLTPARVKEMLRAAGFERRAVHFKRPDGAESSRSYYAGPEEAIE